MNILNRVIHIDLSHVLVLDRVSAHIDLFTVASPICMDVNFGQHTLHIHHHLLQT